MTQRARRDPDTRRRVIVEAAAELIVREGLTELTHRKVAARAAVPLGSTTHYFASLDELREAALALLAGEVADDLAALRDELVGAADVPAVLARASHAYASDPARVRAEAAFYIGSMQNAELRPLATRWFDGLVQLLHGYVDDATARAVAVLLDGAVLYASLRDSPLDEADLTNAIRRLMKDADA